MRKTSRYMIPNMGYITEYNGRYYHLIQFKNVSFWAEYEHEAYSVEQIASGVLKVDESDCREGEWFEPVSDVPEEVINCTEYLDRNGCVRYFE